MGPEETQQQQQLQPGLSGYQPMETPEDKAKRIILESEAAKARMFPNPPGKTAFILDCETAPVRGRMNDYQLIAQIDEDYLLIGGHLDETTQSKIVKGEYVDFGKLLPKDRILVEEDGRMEMVVREGRTYWVPVAETVVINNFSKWEQAFRIFSNVYTRAHPQKSTELIQYNHVIHSIASQYIWDNVYNYNKEFRLHIAKHPERSWSVILQQAWSMRFRDRLVKYEGGGNNYSSHKAGQQYSQNHSGNGKTKGGKPSSGEPCRRFNHGKCNFGSSCHFDHKCAYTPCGKFGHSILNCRKLQADRASAGIRNEGLVKTSGAGQTTHARISRGS